MRGWIDGFDLAVCGFALLTVYPGNPWWKWPLGFVLGIAGATWWHRNITSPLSRRRELERIQREWSRMWE